MNIRNRKRIGFTLIELLVVVAIIALLIAILVPALSKVRTAARVAATKKQMEGIVQACDSYHADFNAYPGPVADSLIDGTVKFSGAQNLYLGLTHRFYPSDPTAIPNSPKGFTKADTLTIWFDNDTSRTMYNYSLHGSPNGLNVVTPGEPNASSFSVYLTPKVAEVSTINNNANSNLGNLDTLPCFVDGAFAADPRPILYYRQVYKWDPEIAANAGVKPVVNTPFASNTTLLTPSAGQACYYASSNSLVDKSVPSTLSAVDQMLTTDTTGSTTKGPIRGPIVLISPGPDRIYGTSDDIIVTAGQ